MDLNLVKQRLSADNFATKTTGIEIDGVSYNSAVCSMCVTEKHLNAEGMVMGGAVFTLADFAFAVAANSGEKKVVSVSASINFLKPAACKKLTATANCVKDGKNMCVYEISVVDEYDNNISKAVITGYVITD